MAWKGDLLDWTVIFGGIVLILIAKFIFGSQKKFIERDIKLKGKKILAKSAPKKEEIFEQEIEIYKPYNYLVDHKGIKARVRRFKEFFMMRFRNADVIGINMELESGKFIEFLIPINKRNFRFAGGTYIIDTEQKYDKINSKYYWIDYHESFCLPISRHIKLKPIRDSFSLKDKNSAEVAYATNPSTLEEFMNSEIAQQILNAEGAKLIKMILVFCIINMFLGLAAIYFAYKSAGGK